MFMTRILMDSPSAKNIAVCCLATLLFSVFFILPSVSNTAFAVSPMPQELEKELERQSPDKTKPAEGDTSCTIKIVYVNGKLSGEDNISIIVVKSPTSRKDALEKAISHIEDKLRDEDIGEVTVDCKFPVSKQKE